MPFVENTWYVAAWSSEIAEQPVGLTIIGKPIVLYRGANGEVVAMDDVCPHRFAPLHRGKVVGNLIECPYHGLRFAANGKCAYSPFDESVPVRAKVRTYPVIERDTFAWIWMGDSKSCDPSAIPDFHWLNEKDKYTMTSEGKLRQGVNYQLVLDNLLDLSHGQFLHPTTLGNEAMAKGVTTTRRVGQDLHSDRWNSDGTPPALFVIAGAVEAGLRVDFWNDMRWTAPGAYYLEVGVTPVGEPRENGSFFGSAHMLTPIDETHTVYRYTLFRTFARDRQDISDGIDAMVAKAFLEEDEPMISAVQKRMAGKDFWSLRPVILVGDKAGIMARRTIDKLLQAEAGGARTAAPEPAISEPG